MTTTVAEPEWDQASRQAALGLAEYERTLCPVCGLPDWICQDPANQFSWTAPNPSRCHAGTALMQKKKGYTEESHSPVDALLFRVVLKDGATGG